MAITLTYGTFSFTAGEPEIRTSETFVFSPSGARERRQVRIDVRGHCQGSTPGAQAEAIRSAFGADDRDFAVADGTAIAHLSYAAADCLRGPKVTALSFPESTGPELASGGRRTYEISLELEQELANPSYGDVVSWKESLSYETGIEGRYQVVETLEGTAEIWQTAYYGAYRVVQSGEAVGRTTWPTAPDAKFPKQVIRRAPYRFDSPEYVILDTDGKVKTERMYRTSWEYEMAHGDDSVMKFEEAAPNAWSPE
jgi:hypothetical protein